MDTTIFCKFISNCLKVNVFCYETNSDSLKEFEAGNCFDSTLQPMYTAEYLSFLISNSKPEEFYEITDYVGTSLLMFSFSGYHFIIGPYVKTLASDKAFHELLASHGLTASIFQQLKIYYSHYPLLDYVYLTDIVLAAMRAFAPMTPDYTHRVLQGFHEELENKELVDSAESSYLQILRRYETENNFLEKIRSGDVDGVSAAFYNSASNFVKTSDQSAQSFYANNHEGFSIMRTLARKAAELGGCPVIKIDEITQDAIQRVNHAKNINDISNIQGEMIINLTKAVAESKEYNKYSVLVKNIVIFIDSNYAKDISLSSIAEASHVSKEHLSREFKKETGSTLSDYIANTRSKKAAELLTTTTLSVAEISAFVGYPDNNYFVKVFKKHYNMTPTEYRNS